MDFFSNMIRCMAPTFWRCDSVKSIAKEARAYNMVEEVNQLVLLVNTWLASFTIEGLPKTMNENYIKEAYLMDGKCGAARDPDYGDIALRCTLSDVTNLYSDYSKISLYGPTYDNHGREFDAYMLGADNTTAQAVLLRANRCMYPYIMYLWVHAKRMASILRSIDVSMQNACLPFVFVGEESAIESAKTLYKKIQSKEPFVPSISQKGFDPSMMQIMQTGFDSSILAAQWDSLHKMDDWGRQQLGWNSNPASDKSERLIVDEVNANNEITCANQALQFDVMQDGWDMWGEMTGQSVRIVPTHAQNNEEALGYGNVLEDGEAENSETVAE